MSNFPTTQVNPANLLAALNESKVNETTDGSGTAFIKFDSYSGVYVFGKDSEDISGETICINVASLQHGWMLWVNNKPNKILAPFNAALPQAMPAETDSDGDLCEPSEARAFQARFLDEDDTILSFETNSYGGRKGVDGLLSAVKLRAAGGEGVFLFPLVKLDSESYKATKAKGRTIYNPVFTVVGWVDAEGNEEETQAKIEAPEEVKEEAPKTRRRRKA